MGWDQGRGRNQAKFGGRRGNQQKVGSQVSRTVFCRYRAVGGRVGWRLDAGKEGIAAEQCCGWLWGLGNGCGQRQ